MMMMSDYDCTVLYNLMYILKFILLCSMVNGMLVNVEVSGLRSVASTYKDYAR